MINPVAPVKNFVVRNQTKILVTIAAVATAGAVYQRMGLKQHDDFLKENGLYEKFYAQED